MDQMDVGLGPIVGDIGLGVVSKAREPHLEIPGRRDTSGGLPSGGDAVLCE